MRNGIVFAGLAIVTTLGLAACGDNNKTGATDTADAATDATSDVGSVNETDAMHGADQSVADAPGSDAENDARAGDAAPDGALADASSEAAADSGSGDSGADSGPSGDAEAGAACSVTNSASTIETASSDAAALPVQTGGSFASGTYHLTAYVWYGGSSPCEGAPIKQTLVIAATSSTTGTLSKISESPGASGDTPSCTENQPYETSGNHFVAADGGVLGTTTFTATSTTITMAVPDSGSCGSVLLTYTKS